MFADYLWVAEETCEVILEISNPLPIDLDVTNIVSLSTYALVNQWKCSSNLILLVFFLLQLLLTSGVVFESIPVSVVLPGNILNQSIILTGVPKEVGELQIKGELDYYICRLLQIIGAKVDSEWLKFYF